MAIASILLTAVLLVDQGAHHSDTCVCAEARVVGGWCGKCEVGYAASLAIRSRTLFEALDAHGHHVDIPALKCATCRRNARKRGYCEECRMGFVDRHAYFSRLSFQLALGEPVPPDRIRCADCSRQSRTAGWCEKCSVGMIGGLRYTDREEFDRTLTEYRTLRKAIELAERCETCAGALVLDTRCPACDITYRKGQRVGSDREPGGPRSGTEGADGAAQKGSEP